MVRGKTIDVASSAVIIAHRAALAFCLSFLFQVVCFAVLRAAESYVPLTIVAALSRIIWWPMAVSCAGNTGDLFCAVPGLIFSLLFYWAVAFALLWRFGVLGRKEFVGLRLQ